MKAVLSDIHGNLEALKAVLADIASRNIHEIVCLGDVVGYGPEPLACMNLTKDSDTLILGNHEEAVLGEAGESFNVRARKAVEWTRKQLLENAEEPEQVRKEREEFLRTWLRQTNILGIQYVHGSPRQPTREYVTPKSALNKKKMEGIFEVLEHICFIGHTHIPGIFTEGGFSHPSELMSFYILGDEKALINVGSVGQPRDGDAKACYVTFDEETVVWRRVEYDVKATVSRIYKIPELDNFLGDRLLDGK
jgi:predicted phosphodiesterase